MSLTINVMQTKDPEICSQRRTRKLRSTRNSNSAVQERRVRATPRNDTSTCTSPVGQFSLEDTLAAFFLPTNVCMKALLAKNLRSLNLSNLGLERFPSEVIGLPNLESLNLSRNKLAFIPYAIASEALPRLTSLNLQSNRLLFLPSSIKKRGWKKLCYSGNIWSLRPDGFSSESFGVTDEYTSRVPLSLYDLCLAKIYQASHRQLLKREGSHLSEMVVTLKNEARMQHTCCERCGRFMITPYTWLIVQEKFCLFGTMAVRLVFCSSECKAERMSVCLQDSVALARRMKLRQERFANW